jgi:lipoate-protein ligase A
VPETWRLLVDEPRDGPENMAVDEALLDLVGEGKAPATLRFYTWQSPWVSLGSGQLCADLDSAALRERGWGLLRRASGGTAVLHEGQLGYALVLPTSHRVWAGDLTASYERLAVPLRFGLNRVGVETHPASTSERAAVSADAPPFTDRICFAALGPHELIAGGQKLVGNSQVRRRFASAQHGVIQLTGGQGDLVDALANVPIADRALVKRYVADHVGSLTAHAKTAVDPSALIEALVGAVGEMLGVSLLPCNLSDEEQSRADFLVRTKYGDPGWTFRR